MAVVPDGGKVARAQAVSPQIESGNVYLPHPGQDLIPRIADAFVSFGRWPNRRILRSRIFRHSGITVAFKTTFEVFTRVDADNSLERLAEGSAGLVTDRSSNVYELLVTLL